MNLLLCLSLLSPAFAAETAPFVRALGDAVYAGASGTLSRSGQAYALVETRVSVQQKTLDGRPSATLRLYRRAALTTNAAHVEALGEDLSIQADGDTLRVSLDGAARPALDVRAAAGTLAFSFVKRAIRRYPPVLERLKLTLQGGRLCVERTESVAGAETERESFCASR